MPGASAASAPSIRLSHFLFAHLLHGFILPFPSPSCSPLSALYSSASASASFRPREKSFALYSWKQNGYDCVRDRSSALLVAAGNVAFFVFPPPRQLPCVIATLCQKKHGERKGKIPCHVGLLYLCKGRKLSVNHCCL